MALLKFSFLILLAFAFAGVAEELGSTHVELIQRRGIPNAIFPVRQEKADLDDIVFVYEDSYYYIYNNRFYRAFFSKHYASEIYQGLKIGSLKSELTALWGDKYALEKDGLVWQRSGHIIVAKISAENRLESIWFIKEAAQ